MAIRYVLVPSHLFDGHPGTRIGLTMANPVCSGTSLIWSLLRFRRESVLISEVSRSVGRPNQ